MIPISRVEFLWLCESVTLALLLSASIATHSAEAFYEDSNRQCPPGGEVGQPCKDNTNGYTTKGKCSFIYVCTATSYEKNKDECDGGVGSPTCPKGKPYKAPPPNRPPLITEKRSGASTSIHIAGRSIAEIEASLLGAAFSSDDDTSPDIDPVLLSDSGNAALRSMLNVTEAEAEEKGLLIYAPESFYSNTSTLFESLRDSAIALSAEKSRDPENLARDPKTNEFASLFAGTFENAPPYVGDSGSARDVQDSPAFGVQGIDDFTSWVGLLVSALMHLLRAGGGVLLADFSEASLHFDAAKADFTEGLPHVSSALSWFMALVPGF